MLLARRRTWLAVAGAVAVILGPVSSWIGVRGKGQTPGPLVQQSGNLSNQQSGNLNFNQQGVITNQTFINQLPEEPKFTDALAPNETLTNATQDLPQLTITNVQFDPNSPTDIYVDFEVANPGKPTVIRDWNLDVIRPDGHKIQGLRPGFVMGGKIVPGPFGKGIAHSDLTEAPLATGDRRIGCRLGFTVPGDPSKEQFGHSGTSFEISAKDVSGHMFSITWVR
jgi:hypothetical protein